MADEEPRSENIFRPDWCPWCGYLLRGLPEAGRCPECGEKFGRDDVVYLFGWDGTDRVATRGKETRWTLAVVFWLLGAYLIGISAWLFIQEVWPAAIQNLVLGAGSLYYATSRVLMDYSKPRRMAVLTKFGFGQRKGFGKVLLYRWGSATEVVLNRYNEAMWYLDITGVTVTGQLDSNRHVSIVFAADEMRIGAIRNWIEECKRARAERKS